MTTDDETTPKHLIEHSRRVKQIRDDEERAHKKEDRAAERAAHAEPESEEPRRSHHTHR